MNFDQLQALWRQQSGPEPSQTAEAIRAKADQSHRQMVAIHRGTMLTLSITVLVVAAYFWKYGSTSIPEVFMSSLLMVFPLLLRIGAEYVSYRLFTGIQVTTDLRTCLARTNAFHRIRQGIQGVLTPLSLGCYAGGFILLLPYVKAGVSVGFYWYIVGSGIVFLLVLSFIIYRQIRREMYLLNELKASYTNLLNE